MREIDIEVVVRVSEDGVGHGLTVAETVGSATTIAPAASNRSRSPATSVVSMFQMIRPGCVLRHDGPPAGAPPRSRGP
jgi:hypothetical protein